jgi:hypothetical protein
VIALSGEGEGITICGFTLTNGSGYTYPGFTVKSGREIVIFERIENVIFNKNSFC